MELERGIVTVIRLRLQRSSRHRGSTTGVEQEYNTSSPQKVIILDTSEMYHNVRKIP